MFKLFADIVICAAFYPTKNMIASAALQNEISHKLLKTDTCSCLYKLSSKSTIDMTEHYLVLL